MTSQLLENESVESHDSQETTIKKKRKRLSSDLKGFFKRRAEESQSDKEPTPKNREAEFSERAQHLLDVRKNNNSPEFWYSKKDKETPENNNKENSEEDSEEDSEENNEEIFKDKNQGVIFKKSKKSIEDMLEDKILNHKEKKRSDETIKYLKDKLQYTREISSSHITVVECLMQNRRREYETNNRIAIQKIERLESRNKELRESLRKCEERVEDVLHYCEKGSKDEDRKANENKIQLLEAQIKKYEEELADRNLQEKKRIQELEAQLLKSKDNLSQSLVGKERMEVMEMQLKKFQEELTEQSLHEDERIHKVEQKYVYKHSLAEKQINELETVNKELKEKFSATESMTDEITIESLETEHLKNELEFQIKDQEKSRKLYEQEKLQTDVLYWELQDGITNAVELVFTIKSLICVFEELKKDKETLFLTISKLETSLETLEKYLPILAKKKQRVLRHSEDSERMLNERREYRPRNLKTALEETRGIEGRLQKIKEIISLAISQ
ncbi:hypothetical protein G6F56_007614 [Rhizopus delemar]|uniref:Uncharacterized protein n=1 Tax=Rhizopus stolonifer TaxID=4846 RepID=A0A367KR62_RHIST|nr:hypothetical protein G6F56_007614 [Rhizopus delemar]RCI04661.1 hypothetical protein CU098_011258 [Rhizopus stolonifer]